MSQPDETELARTEVSRRDALRLAAAVGALGVGLGVRPAEAGDGDRANASEPAIKFRDGRYDAITVKLYDAPADPKTPPTVLKSLDVGGAMHEMSKAVIQNVKAKSAFPDTAFTIKLVASRGAEAPTTLFERTVVVQPPTTQPPPK